MFTFLLKIKYQVIVGGILFRTLTTDTEERYALCACLAVTPSVRCL